VIVIFILGAAAFAVWHFRTTPAASQGLGQTPPVRNPRPDEPLLVTRYLPARGALVPSLVPVLRESDTQAQAREVLNAVLSGENRGPVLSDISLRGFFLASDGTAYVDITVGSQYGSRGSSASEEFLALYSVVNTLTQNFEEIRQVRFLVEGREAQTLAGHVDIARVFTKRMDLVKQ
jgi:hypothetical protein